MRRAYLDHAATSPLRPEVREAMAPWWGVPANPSSVHREGRRAAAALERARDEVAAFLGRPSEGIVFCSGATEALHHAILALTARHGPRVALAGIEHPAVRGAVGNRPTIALRTGPDGVVEVGDPPVDVVCLAAANHETGVRQPIEAALARGRPLLVDASHAAGRVPVRLPDAAAVVISAHKLGGPVGVGALSLRDGGAAEPLLRGGSQERGRRAGTVDVAGAVGLAAACRTVRPPDPALDDVLRDGLRALGAAPVGDWARTVPGTTAATFPGALGESVVQALDLAGVAVSAGAACASGSVQPSPVLVAMGHPEPRGIVRFSLAAATTRAEVDAALAALAAALPRLSRSTA